MDYRADNADADLLEWRFDRAPLGAPRQTAEGYIIADGIFARPGVLEYRRADGSVRRELVRAETLAEALDSITRKPVTLGHPSREDRPVGPHNVQRLSVGDVDGAAETLPDGSSKVSLAVRADEAIQAVRRGQRELSPGYQVALDPTPGVHPEYGAYDAEQIRRRYDHLAIVQRARGGHSVRLRADEAEIADPPPMTSTRRPIMLLVLAQLLGLSYNADTADEKVVEGCTKAIGDLKVKADRVDALEAERDAATARADAAEEAKVAAEAAATQARADAEDLSGRIQWHQERTVLEQRADEYGVPSEGRDEMTNAALRRAVVAKAKGSDLRADASDAYIEAAFDLLPPKGQGTRGDGLDHFRVIKGPRHAPPEDDDGKRSDKRRRIDGTKAYNDVFDANQPKPAA